MSKPLSIKEQAKRVEIKAEVLDELRRAVCLIGIITDRDGHDLIRRDSVLDIINQRRFNH